MEIINRLIIALFILIGISAIIIFILWFSTGDIIFGVIACGVGFLGLLLMGLNWIIFGNWDNLNNFFDADKYRKNK